MSKERSTSPHRETAQAQAPISTSTSPESHNVEKVNNRPLDPTTSVSGAEQAHPTEEAFNRTPAHKELKQTGHHASPSLVSSTVDEKLHLQKPKPAVRFCDDPVVISDVTGQAVATHDSPNSSPLTTWTRIFMWGSSIYRLDPRHQILRFFNDVARQGARDILNSGEVHASFRIDKKIKMFQKSGVFTVWRPTSADAIRKMMTRDGVGKGLDIKGKSARKGDLSGYVPFLQIHENEHKRFVRTQPKDGRMKVFYGSRALRDEAAAVLQDVRDEMAQAVVDAMALLVDETAEDDAREVAMQRALWDMSDPSVIRIDDFQEDECYGLEVAKRLFWEAYVMRQDCTRVPGSKYETGRPSEPAFQDMNFAAVDYNQDREEPHAVVWQSSKAEGTAMCPLSLLMAYEEKGRVRPVVSDFDCFLVGTRGVPYEEPLPPDQIDLVKWSVSEIGRVLDNPPSTDSWTKQWLDVLKENAAKGFHPETPKFGFGDPMSYTIVEHAVDRLVQTGAVRHGAECFNYYFPQELDNHYLIVSDTLPGNIPWKYVNAVQLQEFLLEKIEGGFTFPLNPKWVLCDQGWKNVYDKLMSSKMPNVQSSLDVWYPPESGLREWIESTHSKHPDGFIRVRATRRQSVVEEGTGKMDLAKMELHHYIVLRRAKLKLKAAQVWKGLLEEVRKRNALSNKPSKETDGSQNEELANGDSCDVDEKEYHSNNNDLSKGKVFPADSPSNSVGASEEEDRSENDEAMHFSANVSQEEEGCSKNAELSKGEVHHADSPSPAASASENGDCSKKDGVSTGEACHIDPINFTVDGSKPEDCRRNGGVPVSDVCHAHSGNSSPDVSSVEDAVKNNHANPAA